MDEKEEFHHAQQDTASDAREQPMLAHNRPDGVE
jgi:hypothetical protein